MNPLRGYLYGYTAGKRGPLRGYLYGHMAGKRGNMNRKKVIITGAAACAGVVLIGTGLWFWLGRDKGAGSENVVYVNSVDSLMNPGNTSGILNRFAGVVETQESLEIPASQDQTVKEIYVEEGQEVQVGTPLFIYDTEKTSEELEKAQLQLERISNEIGNKYNELAALEKEKKTADKSAQLDYTIQIQEAQLEVKRSEYEKESKQAEIRKLKDTIENATVTSKLAGVVKSINDGSSQAANYGESQAFMTIIAMGDFRVKGMVNEQNMGSIMEGQPVLIHSRVDEDVVWKGTMGKVDTENPGNDNSNGYYVSTGDSTTQSNSYPFYVQLDSSEGLMLGQHVYIEADYGQEEERPGIWLDDYFLVTDEDGSSYVWADDGKGRLEKKEIITGQHDDDLMKTEIADGLKEEDLITWPEEGLEEGMSTARGDAGQMGQSNPEPMEETDMLTEDGAVPDTGEVLTEDGTASDGEIVTDEGTEGTGDAGAAEDGDVQMEVEQ